MSHVRHSVVRRIALFAALVAVSNSWAVAADGPAVLFLGGGAVEAKPLGNPNKYRISSVLPASELQTLFGEKGIIWTADFFSTQTTWEQLCQFDAIVMLDFPIPQRYPSMAEDIRRVEGLLQRFVEEGGGLLLTGSTQGGMWAQERNIEEMNRFLEAFGAQVLLEQIEEADGSLRIDKPSRPSPSALAWTGNITPHPVTESVEGLIYPTFYAQTYYAHALDAPEPWQVLIRGSQTARTYTVSLGSGREAETKQAGSVDSEPAMLAVREFGAGRVALWPTIPSTTLIDGYHRYWGGGMIMDGDHSGLPSDGQALVLNLIDWLTEQAPDTLGGYEHPPIEEEDEEPGLRAIDWDAVDATREQFPNQWRGLIGMKSDISTGRDTPRAMINAAREAGYDFAAFAEDLSELTPEKLEALKEACAEASNETFQAYPGFTYFDASGNEWLVFGPSIIWPKDNWWDDRDAGTIVINNVVFRGNQFLPLIMLHPNLNPEKAWFQGNFKGIAVQTWEGAELADDATEVYRRLQGDDYRLFATAVHLVRSVDEVRQAAAPDRMQTVVPWFELTDLMSAFTGTGPSRVGRHVWHWPQYASSGPVIDDFKIVNFGVSDQAIKGNDRFRMHVQARSDAGISEVAVYDGTSIWRRFAVGGEREWSVTLDGFHDMRRFFTVQVTDANGGTAVSSSIYTGVQELSLQRCSDNINTFVTGKFDAPPVFPIRGLENYIEKLAGTTGCFPQIPGADETRRFAVDQRLPMVSRFGYIHHLTFDHIYPPTATSNWNRNDIPERAAPNPLLEGEATVTLFTPWSDGTSVYLVDGQFTAKADLAEIDRVLVAHNRWVDDAEVFYESRTGGNGRVTCFRPGRPFKFGGTFEDGTEYAANLGAEGGSRAIFPLAPHLTYAGLVNRDAGTATLLSYIQPEGGSIAAGDTVAYRYLAAFSEVGGEPDTHFIEAVCDGLGLRGKPAYSIEPTQGSVMDRTYALRLKAEDHGFAGTISRADLPFRLPVFVDGLNPRWPAGVWYAGENRLVMPVWKMDDLHQRYSTREERTMQDPLFRFGVLPDGTGMLQVDTLLGDRRVFIGNLLVCDTPGIFLELEQWEDDRLQITANNPTDAEITTTIRPGPGFDLVGEFAETVTLAPGAFVRVFPGATD